MYGFDLNTHVLYRIADVIAGRFVAAPDGSAFSSISVDSPEKPLATNYVSTYSEITHRTNLIAIPRPSLVNVRSTFIDFYIGASFHPDSIIKYDLIQETKSEQKNLPINFDTPDREKFKVGKSYVFFDGTERPFNGTKLIIAPYPPEKADIIDARRRKCRVIKSFSRFTAGLYFFQCVSPSGKYALVRLDKPAWGKDGYPHTSHTYYIVDLESGKTEKLLLDETSLQSQKGFVVGLAWVAQYKKQNGGQ
jgi:hypothetical protein